jgi:hypothetical protein
LRPFGTVLGQVLRLIIVLVVVLIARSLLLGWDRAGQQILQQHGATGH